MTREMGKVLKETRGDVQEAIDTAYYMAGEGRRLFGQTTPVRAPNKFAMCVRQPVGVCGMITPWNFPMAIPSWKLFPALVCGNTCVIKPAQDTPLSTYNFVSGAADAGMPKGVVNIVTGFGTEVGRAACIEHPDVRAISFTGSSGRRPHRGHDCRARLQALLARNGRQEPDDRARRRQPRSRARRRALGSVRHHRPALHRHQPHHRAEGCLQASSPKSWSRAPSAARSATASMRPSTWVRRSTKRRSRPTEYVEIGKNEGAKLLCGGKRLDKRRYAHGFFFEPTVFSDVDPKMRIAQEEIFGPVVSIIPCDGLDDAIEIANDIEYGLSSAIYTKDVNRAFRAIRDLDAGITYINAPTIGAEVHLPFGGVKQPATATAKAASAPSTSTPSGSPSTSTTPTSCRRPRSTDPSSYWNCPILASCQDGIPQ